MTRNQGPILTVAIPTHNRSQTLRKVLYQLYKERTEKFRIIVSDNNSSDDTESVVKNYQKRMKNLRYWKNEKNLGSWGNLFNLYKISKTRYIWFLSDDEEILPGAIEKIVNSLKKYQPTVALFNHIKMDPFGRKVVDGVSQDAVFDNIRKLDDYGRLTRAGFMSIIVMEKRFSPELIKEEHIKDNYFFQMTLVILALQDRFKFCEIATPIVFRNTGYKSGEFFKFMFTDLLESIFIVNRKFDKEKFITDAKRQFFKSFKVYLSQKIGLIKFYGRPSVTTIKKIFRYYGLSSLFIISFPIIKFLIPTFVLKFAYRNDLQRIHGKEKGLRIYKKNINRVLRFNRVSGHLD